MPARPAAFALVLTAILGGCAAQTSMRYPSLLPRAIESRSDAEPETAVALADPEPSTDSALAELHKTLDRTAADFTPAAARAERLADAAKGDAPGGERWIAAQTALAELDGYRATTSATLSTIDTMASDRITGGKPDYPAIATLQSAAQAAFEAQSARIAAIGAKLPGA
ncbi:hypothetical protein EAH76_07810 [Sphingomonas glacialis]|uniref:Uncharacterized protein n=1 Tax=Sphingomonas glacialis TaxID=658225 RepID=A0A502G0K6_9SPHN|nr:hypothetical protein EAH76_07810 [Sphingomonas glacialis]